MKDYQILLYYKYTHLADPEALMQAQLELCRRLKLNGRIIIAKEGINGTLEGTTEATEEYMRATNSVVGIENMPYKISQGNGTAFPKLSVKLRPEIVSAHLGEEDFNPADLTATHLKPEELKQWIERGKNFVIVDMRNNYEHKSGHFAGSVLSDMDNFRDLKKILPDLEHLKEKTVLTVCTGGVRCEKASGYLLKKGFKDVYQLDGGIVTYMEKYPNQDFKGSLYVFDGRVTMGFNLEDPQREVVGECENCTAKSENYVNCSNLNCHRHFILCEACIANNDDLAFCDNKCKSEYQKSKNK